MIAATNRKLQDEVRQGDSARISYYRLNVLPIELPPLRERPDDIPRLVNFYVDTYNTRVQEADTRRDRRCDAALQRYGWPGNIRELRNTVERAMLLAEGDDADRSATCRSAAPAPVRLTEQVELPAGGIDLEQLERSLRRPGARAERVEPDQGGRRCSV